MEGSSPSVVSGTARDEYLETAFFGYELTYSSLKTNKSYCDKEQVELGLILLDLTDGSVHVTDEGDILLDKLQRRRRVGLSQLRQQRQGSFGAAARDVHARRLIFSSNDELLERRLADARCCADEDGHEPRGKGRRQGLGVGFFDDGESDHGCRYWRNTGIYAENSS